MRPFLKLARGLPMDHAEVGRAVDRVVALLEEAAATLGPGLRDRARFEPAEVREASGCPPGAFNPAIRRLKRDGYLEVDDAGLFAFGPRGRPGEGG